MSPPPPTFIDSNPPSSLASGMVEKKQITRVACIGAGYVGAPTCAVIALKNPHIKVVVVDSNAARIKAWNSSSLPIFEPGLWEVIREVRDKNLFFSPDVDTAIKEAELIFVSVGTPTKPGGLGGGLAADLGAVEAATRHIALTAHNSKIIVEKSTVPCRTAHSMRVVLEANARPGVHFDILSNPEFLAEGSAIHDLLYPDRVLIGSRPTESAQRATELLSEIYSSWIPPERILTTSLWSSELSKLAANAMLAQRISSINALSAICEATGADVEEVSLACGMDKRIGPYFLKASVGFGGSCFRKDVSNLVYLSESLHLYEVAEYWRQVITLNDYQTKRFADRVIHNLFNSLTGKKIAVFGFAFKKNTGDTRESAAIKLVKSFLSEGGRVDIFDPKVPEEQVWHELVTPETTRESLQSSVQIVKSPYEAAIGAAAVVIATEWDEFKCDHLDYQKIYDGMHKPAYLFDGRLIVDQGALKEIGFRVEVIGKGAGRRREGFE